MIVVESNAVWGFNRERESRHVKLPTRTLRNQLDLKAHTMSWTAAPRATVRSAPVASSESLGLNYQALCQVD